ncbi:hypothetical protein H4R19_002217 [Coemansia spiralis]|nr:hypothetical protein H4R19_002217 [Coemansia spiralis]
MSTASGQRISIVGGSGNVGAATAFALIANGVDAEVLLVDLSDQAVKDQALDIGDASFELPGTCRQGSYREAGKSDIIILTAGAPQKPNEPRSDLIDRNYMIIKSIMDSMEPLKPTARILMVSNPVDVMTDLAQKVSGLPRDQVIGSGTCLDSYRLCNELSTITGVSAESIHAYILGEHGEHQFPAWSAANIGGRPLLGFPKMRGVDLDSLYDKVQSKAYEIIDAKGSPYYGIGACVATLAEALLNNAGQVFPVTNYVEKCGCYISWPAAIGQDGVEQSIDLRLDGTETAKLESAINAIKSAYS